MAIVKAPFFGLGAAGALGKTLVYFGWKGLNVVRTYVVPSNPKTALQVTQRGYVTDAVAMVHTAQAEAVGPLGEVDQIAYSALAAAKGKRMTWFNQAVKLWVDVAVALKTSIVYHDMDFVDKSHDNISLNAKILEETPSDLADGKWYFGTSKTNLIHSSVATILAGVNCSLSDVDLSAFLTAGVKYYCQFRPDVGDLC